MPKDIKLIQRLLKDLESQGRDQFKRTSKQGENDRASERITILISGGRDPESIRTPEDIEEILEPLERDDPALSAMPPERRALLKKLGVLGKSGADFTKIRGHMAKEGDKPYQKEREREGDLLRMIRATKNLRKEAMDEEELR